MISTTCLSALTWLSTLNIMHMTFTVTTRNWYKYNKPMLVKRTKNQGFNQLKTPAFMTRQLIRVINKFRFVTFVCSCFPSTYTYMILKGATIATRAVSK